MKRKHLLWISLLGTGMLIWWCYFKLPEPTILSLTIGQPYDEVVRNSTYPVLANNPLGNPRNYESRTGFINVTEPSVILKFDDAKYGFDLPPTKFVAVLFMDSKVNQFQTSPMLEALPYEETVELMAKLQDRFKTLGWQPWPVNGSEWFDFSPAGRKRLYEHLPHNNWNETATLVVPGIYGMSFRIKCIKGCGEASEIPLFLIDIGMADDFYNRINDAK
jgi:hypothetical protein